MVTVSIWPAVVGPLGIVAVLCPGAMQNEMAVLNRRRRLIYLIAIIVTIFILFLLYNSYSRSSTFPHTAASSSSQGDLYYGIMFDAGSTGSRIHVFKFNRLPGGSYKLLDELFEHIKPGLSSYASDPTKAAESLRPLLDKAKNYVPQVLWSETSLALKATAGLRLISNQSAVAILNEVMKLFRTYPFRVTDNGVAILEGEDEGLYSWFTVNLLEGTLSSAAQMVGVMDLGGGSTQVTYALPQSSSGENSVVSAHALNVHLFNQSLQLYTRSYLGLGLNSGRFQILGGKETKDGIVAGQFSSACFVEGFTGHLQHAGANHSISYKASPGVNRYDACYAAAKNVIQSYNMKKISNQQSGLYAISYYFDKAASAGLIDKENGGVVKVQDFFRVAKQSCESMTASSKEFTCMDLCYISSLLHDGLGISQTTTIKLRKRIGNVEIAWPLGAMFNVLGQFNKINTVT